MSPQGYELRIPARRLLIAMLLTVLPISLTGLYSLSQSEKSLERTIGTHFKTIAESTAAEVAQFVHDRVMDVGVMAVSPAIRDAVEAANRSYEGMSEEAVAARISRIEKIWNTSEADPVVSRMLGSQASRMLRKHRELDPRFLRITVTDARGAAIAATHKTLDYFQADEAFWQAIYAQGRGAVNVTDMLYDEVTKSYYIGIGVPVLEEATNRFVGAVDALVDLSSLFPFVRRVRLGPTARASLVKEDGTIIVSPEGSLSAHLKSGEYSAVQDALRTLEGRQTGYVVADVPGGARKLIAFADTGLRDDYRNLGWIVLVSQDVQEAFAPTRTVVRLMALMALIGLAMVVVLAMYVSLHREAPLTDIGPAGEVPGRA
jgi:hypothetical protein